MDQSAHGQEAIRRFVFSLSSPTGYTPVHPILTAEPHASSHRRPVYPPCSPVHPTPMTPTPAEFTKGSKSPSKPTECLEHVVRYDATGDAVAVVYFTVWQHHLDFFVLQPNGIVNPTTDRVLGVIEAPDRAEVFAEGSLKWSGCINFSVGDEGHYAHACDSEMLHKLLSHVEWVYTLGPKIPAWEGGE